MLRVAELTFFSSLSSIAFKRKRNDKFLFLVSGDSIRKDEFKDLFRLSILKLSLIDSSHLNQLFFFQN